MCGTLDLLLSHESRLQPPSVYEVLNCQLSQPPERPRYALKVSYPTFIQHTTPYSY